MSTLNKAQVVKEGGRVGTDNTQGRGGSALKLKAASEFDSFWMSTLNKAQLRREGGREGGREGRGMITHVQEGRRGSVCHDGASCWTTCNKRV